jgi:hypothetical protein
MTFEQPADLVPIILIGSAILAGLLWLIKAQISMQKEFRPNGGSSMRDAMNRIEKDVRDVRYRMDKHIDNHNA